MAKRSLFPRMLAATLCVVRLCSVASEARPDNANTLSSGVRRMPNILMFQPDDMPWVSSWKEAPSLFDGNPNGVFRRDLDTPYMNRIRSGGAVFTNAMGAGSNCALSRYSTVMGRYNSRGLHARSLSQDIEASVLANQVTANIDTPRLIGTDLELNLPNALRSAGYRTGASGKWHLRPERDAQPHWLEHSRLQQLVRDAGFDWADGIYDHVMNGDLPFSHNMEWVTAKAKGFISECKAMDKPFMLYFNPTTPRDPNVYTALFNFTLLDTPAGTLSSIPDSGMPSRAEMWQKAQEVLTAEEIATAGATGVPTNNASQALGTVVTDESLGALMRHMEELGVLDNTVIIVKADHGVIEKSSIYQGGALVPFFAMGPAPFDKPQTVSHAISTVDLAPTMMDLAGLEYPYLTDGQSFLPLVRGDEAFWNVVFIETEVNRAVRAPNSMKLIHLNPNSGQPISQLHPGAASAYQLYNLTADPEEQVNLFYHSEYSSEAAKLLRGLLCFETKLRLSADNTGSVRIDDCKAMVMGGAEEHRQERFSPDAHAGNFAPAAFGYSESAAAMKPGGSSVSTHQQASGSGTGWMKSLFATPMIETFLTSIVSAFSSAKPSNITINGQ